MSCLSGTWKAIRKQGSGEERELDFERCVWSVDGGKAEKVYFILND